MEKLQPLITHRFWVGFGLALLVPFIGWWVYQGSVTEAIAEREEAVQKAKRDSTKGNGVPNKDWIEQAQLINKEHQSRFHDASAYLWQQQQDDKAMFWPKRVEKFVEGLPFRTGCSEEGAPEFPAERGGPDRAKPALTHYKRDYGEQFEQILKRITPYDYETRKGLVEVNPDTIHHLPYGSKGVSAWPQVPTWDDVWDAQEDMWLLAELLKSLAEVNKNSRTIAEAQIRQILELTFKGGNLDEKKSKKKKAGASFGGSMAGDGRVAASSGSMGGGGGQSASLSGAMGGGVAKSGGSTLEYLKGGDVDFPLEEEFGSDALTEKKKGGMSNLAGGSFAGSSLDSSAPSAAANVRRYVNDAKDMPFRTRGFKLRMTIRTDSLPAILEN